MMSKNSKLLIAIVLINLFLLGIFIRSTVWRSITLDQYNSIETRTPKSEVEQMLGRPLKISSIVTHHGQATVWIYNIKTSIHEARFLFATDKDGQLIVESKCRGWEAFPHN